MIVLIPVLIIAAAVVWYGYCEARKAYWDHWVKEMCEKDGGVRVYEKIVLDAQQYEAIFPTPGFTSIPYKKSAKSDTKYYLDNQIQYIRSANPAVWKMQTKVIRNPDRKILGEKIYYARVGGDFPTWAHDSSFGCAYMPNQTGSFLHKIFILRTGEK